MANNNEQKKPATLDDVLIALQQNQKTLNEINLWIKISGAEKAQTLLTKCLDTPEKIIVYHLSDGKTTREIGAMCSLDPKTISNYWRAWNRLGMMRTEAVRGGYRYLKAFEPEDYGIKVPPLVPKTTSQKTSPAEQQSLEQTVPRGDEGV